MVEVWSVKSSRSRSLLVNDQIQKAVTAPSQPGAVFGMCIRSDTDSHRSDTFLSVAYSLLDTALGQPRGAGRVFLASWAALQLLFVRLLRSNFHRCTRTRTRVGQSRPYVECACPRVKLKEGGLGRWLRARGTATVERSRLPGCAKCAI